MTGLAVETELAQLRRENRELRALVAEYEAAGVVVVKGDEQREAACRALWKLQPLNARVLLAMVDRPGRVCSKSFLLPYASNAPDDIEGGRLIDVRIHRIRKALHAKVIETHKGAGYRVLPPVAQTIARQIALWSGL